MAAALDNPLFLRVSLPLHVLSVQLPVVLREKDNGLRRYTYQKLSRVLCPQINQEKKLVKFSEFEVIINSAAELTTGLDFNLTVSVVNNFELR